MHRDLRSISRIPSTSRRRRMSAERPAALRDVCPFRLVADEDADQLSRETTMTDAAPGSIIFEEGDPTDGVAAILEGRVEVLKQSRVLATLGPGSVLGELSLFMPSATRTATARGDTAPGVGAGATPQPHPRVAPCPRMGRDARALGLLRPVLCRVGANAGNGQGCPDLR